MTCTAAFAPFALALAAGAVQANQLDGNVVGGGGALSGGGDNMVITYSTGGAGGGSGVLSLAGRPARLAGSQGDGSQVEYLPPASAGAGREAWLLGGGDGAEVLYVRPR